MIFFKKAICFFIYIFIKNILQDRQKLSSIPTTSMVVTGYSVVSKKESKICPGVVARTTSVWALVQKMWDVD